MLGKGGNAGEYVQDDGAVLSPVTEDAVHDIVYHLAVTQRSLALRHGDEHEVQLVRQIYEPLVHLREVDSHIEDDESYGRDYLGESPVSAEHLCPAQGGQLEQVLHADAHIRHLLELFPRV